MSKAVLVVDMPNSCEECIFHNYHFCNVTGESIDKILYDLMEDDKLSTCPIKELPEEIHNKLYMDEYSDGYDNGWNSFRAAIIGGLENEE